jgi:peptidoglycan/LPS O-acetylase OafA/YrhL
MGIVRFLLALSVVITHCGSLFGTSLVFGQIAVQSFYIISGFYMSLILNEKYIGVNGSYKLFITNRFYRIYPIYWTVLICIAVTCLAAIIATNGHYLPLFGKYLSVKANFFSFLYLILTNLLIFGQDLVMFMGIYPESGHLYFTSDFMASNPPLFTFLFIQQAWTLGLELTFYLIAPLIVKRGYKLVVTLIVLSFLLRLFIYNYLGFQHDPWTYRFFPTEIMFFLFGYLSYHLHLKVKKLKISKTLNLFALAFIILFTIFYGNIPPLKINYLPFSIKDMMYFASIVLSIPLLFNFLKKSKFDNQIGELSYPIYISHMFVLMVFSSLPVMPLKISYVVAFFTIVFSLLLNRFIANPVDKFRQSRLVK